MKFGPLPTTEAEGAILAHGVVLPDGRLSKGTRLSQADLARLLSNDIDSVIVAQLAQDDLTEDVAAERLVDPVLSPGIRSAPASTGRVNLYATENGLLRVDKEAVDGFNRIDPAITLASLADYSAVHAGDMVATIKIIPLAVPGAIVETAAAVLRGRRALTLKPYRAHGVALIQTRLPQLKTSVMDKTAERLQRRLAASGSVVTGEQRVAHREDEVAAAITSALQQDHGSGPHMVILFGASAVCDAHDVLPQAIRKAGGVIDRVGLPVDPGNLLVLAHCGAVPIIVAPGCARSPKENGFDWILSRLMAGEVPSEADLSGLGVGGLLMEIPSRPRPREADRPSLAGRDIGAILLAAGRASRMGEAGHKLLARFDGVPLVRRMAERALDALPGPIVAVTGYRAPDVASALHGLPLTVVDNPDFATGMASSLKAGLSAAVLSDSAGVMVLLGDMPGLTSDDLQRLSQAFVEAEGRAIVRAVAAGKRGNPVILPRSTFADLMALEGDVGARHVIETCGLPIIDVEIGEAAHLDVDTPEAVLAAGGILPPMKQVPG
ncbi:NTP transferase domain-containing protein [Rhizobium sp. SSA_523]|uniref:NTP transferase domain-containing protein n=1 Tax=Rhizobium sp. SSA_523 TaxID=2952477 RepID=UPI00209101DE|nr:molybdopterin-binding/glycosyltransferase family 2 protein [Rhizobium sp. SSA_523]MCO5729950.1 molybdopterin-binding/glycosyltransferase family 2 protein [Rhizobium sp. SSA_523]WKC25030.1 molybdopterin-binding/glycosyltransferase family 2 protein [Rhizobium sp. SSA_523]